MVQSRCFIIKVDVKRSSRIIGCFQMVKPLESGFSESVSFLGLLYVKENLYQTVLSTCKREKTRRALEGGSHNNNPCRLRYQWKKWLYKNTKK